MQRQIRKIVLIGIVTRLSVIALQCVANALVPDHDADVFLYPQRNISETIFDKSIKLLLGGFLRWDAQYFMHIALYGYTYENTLAFFPLYPMIVRAAAAVSSPFISFINEESLLLLIFVILNCYLFIDTTVVLYKLTVAVTRNYDVAYKSAVLFCFNPATVFFVAPYSECLFSYLTLKGMLNCVLMYNNVSTLKFKFKSLIFFALSTCVRSNGILNIGFLMYFNTKLSLKTKRPLKVFESLLFVLCLLPFIIVQIYDYLAFCTTFSHGLDDFLVDFATVNKLILPGSVLEHHQSWCYNKIPLAYSYIQDNYWNVGFLRYFEIKQIPNFILALPLVILISLGTFKFIQAHARYCAVLGLHKCKSVDKEFGYDPEMFVFVIHSAALTVFCFFCIHVQVSTRMICSASPVVYWYSAYYFKNVKERSNSIQNLFLFGKNLNRNQKLIAIYFVSYCIIGIVMFSNFLPWT